MRRDALEALVVIGMVIGAGASRGQYMLEAWEGAESRKALFAKVLGRISRFCFSVLLWPEFSNGRAFVLDTEARNPSSGQ